MVFNSSFQRPHLLILLAVGWESLLSKQPLTCQKTEWPVLPNSGASRPTTEVTDRRGALEQRCLPSPTMGLSALERKWCPSLASSIKLWERFLKKPAELEKWLSVMGTWVGFTEEQDGGRRGQTPQSCHLTLTYLLWYICLHIHTMYNNNNNKE